MACGVGTWQSLRHLAGWIDGRMLLQTPYRRSKNSLLSRKSIRSGTIISRKTCSSLLSVKNWKRCVIWTSNPHSTQHRKRWIVTYLSVSGETNMATHSFLPCLNPTVDLDFAVCHSLVSVPSSPDGFCSQGKYGPLHIGETVALPTRERLDGWWISIETGYRPGLWSLSYAYECATAIMKNPTWDCSEYSVAAINWANDLCIAWYAWADWIRRTRDHMSPLLATALDILDYLNQQGFRISPVYRNPIDLDEDLREIYQVIRTQVPKTAWK